MKKLVSLVLFVLLLSACRETQPEEGLNYSTDMLKSVISDMYIASEAVKKMDPAVQDSMRAVYNREIALIHGVEMEKIQDDLIYLPNHPEFYTEFHKGIRDSLIAFEKEINAMKYD